MYATQDVRYALYTLHFQAAEDEGTFLGTSINAQRIAGVDKATSHQDAVERMIAKYPSWGVGRKIAVVDNANGMIKLFHIEPPTRPRVVPMGV